MTREIESSPQAPTVSPLVVDSPERLLRKRKRNLRSKVNEYYPTKRSHHSLDLWPALERSCAIRFDGMRLRHWGTAYVVSVGLLSTLLCAQNPNLSDAPNTVTPQTGAKNSSQPKLPADHANSISPIHFTY